MTRLLGIATGSVVVTLTAAALVTGTALGYFTASGAGQGSTGVAKLSASPPTLAATPAVGGTVALSWSAVSPPGPGTVTYSLSRDGEAPGGDCPDSPTSGVISCTDSGVAVGTHSYVVTAKWRSWSVSSTVATAKITIGAAAKLVLTAASATPAAGATNNLTITAKDASNNTVTNYTGLHSLTFSGASASPSGTAPTVVNNSSSAIPFGSATAINFSAGVATVSSSKNGVMRLYKSGVTEIAVNDGSISTATPLIVTVSTLAASKLGLTPGSTTPTAGAANNLTISAQDTYGNTITTYTGARNLTFSGASASPGGTLPTVSNSAGTAIAFGSATSINFSAGVATVSGAANGVMVLYKAAAASIKVSDGTLSSANVATTTSATTASKFILAAASTTPAAGATDSLTITAQDAYANTVTAHTGSHSLVFSGSSASPNGTLPSVIDSGGTAIAFGGATAITFTAGVAKVASSKNGVMRLYRAEATSVAVSEGPIASAPLAVTVSPTTATKLAFSSVTISAGVLGSTCLFTCSVTGLGNSGTVKAKINVTDAYGNTVSAIGSGHTVTVTANGGTMSGGSLAFPATGAAESTTQFTYTSKSAGTFSDTITAATTAGTTYTSATATTSR